MSLIIDVSHHNGNIDWSKVVKTVDSVYIKTTQGIDYVDPMLFVNAKGASAAGLKVGYYHFASLNNSDVVSDAKKEAQWFMANVKKAPKNTLPLVLDIEENKAKLSPDKVLSWISTFLYEIAQLGCTDYMIYSYSPFLNDNLPKVHTLNTIKLWVADYNPPLILPKAWKTAYMWQYSQTGKVDGIIGNVDLNKYI